MSFNGDLDVFTEMLSIQCPDSSCRARYGAAGTFARYTIPIRMRVGWYFGTDRFESEGESFRVTIDDGVYR
jgi:hypothetical protein